MKLNMRPILLDVRARAAIVEDIGKVLECVYSGDVLRLVRKRQCAELNAGYDVAKDVQFVLFEHAAVRSAGDLFIASADVHVR